MLPEEGELVPLYINSETVKYLYIRTDRGEYKLDELLSQSAHTEEDMLVTELGTAKIMVKTDGEGGSTYVSMSASPYRLCNWRPYPGGPSIWYPCP
jgi:hypothetical protein